MNMRDAFANTMYEVGEKDDKLVVVVGDISHGILGKFRNANTERYFNIGILEPTMVSLSAGLARSGLYPVTHTIAPFLIERSLEQIKLDFCYQAIGGNLVSVGSAFDYAALGCSHHCYSDLSVIKAIPNTQVVYPASAKEFSIIFNQTYKNNLLTYFRLPGSTHGVDFDSSEISLGKAIRVREGKDLTVIAAGPQLKTIMGSIDGLHAEGIDTEVLYYSTYKPFDTELVQASLSKTKNCLVIEEHSQFGGLGDEVLRATANLDSCKYSFINIPDKFHRNYGSYKEHCEALGFSVENIVGKARLLLKGK